MNIGFVGLGNMGSGMANNLINYCNDSRNYLIVLDINIEAMSQIVDKGAT